MILQWKGILTKKCLLLTLQKCFRKLVKIEKEGNHVSPKHMILTYIQTHKLLLKWRVNDINLDIHSKLKSSLNFRALFSLTGRNEMEWKHVVCDLSFSRLLHVKVCLNSYLFLPFSFYFSYSCNANLRS